MGSHVRPVPKNVLKKVSAEELKKDDNNDETSCHEKANLTKKKRGIENPKNLVNLDLIKVTPLKYNTKCYELWLVTNRPGTF